MAKFLQYAKVRPSSRTTKKGESIMKRIGIVVMITVVLITGVVAAPVRAEATGTYTVRRGDTLSRIAARHGVSVSQLARANGLRWNSWVYVGQTLIIPADTLYSVQRGDTLGSIAHQFGTTVQTIMRVNGLRSTRIYVGQQLVIPGTLPTPSPVDGRVDGWVGRLVNLPPGSQHTHCFERADGQRFGIGAFEDTVTYQIEQLRWTAEQIRVWGTLRTDVPSYAGRYIQVQRLEAISGPAPEARNLTSLAKLSASSYLPTDPWGQYQPWMAADGSLATAWVEGTPGAGIGEWIMLTFPGTIEIHSISMDIGYDRDAHTFVKNNRTKRATLIFSNGEHIELGFADRRGLQTIPLVRAPGPGIETTFVQVVIEEVYRGSKYDDTCLAEIQVWGRTK
jgi:LysM repeat protein